MALIMTNSIMFMGFFAHDSLHTKIIKNPHLRWLMNLLGFAIFWMPPTLWKVVHNQEHHNKTNSLQDPDRSYLYQQPNHWGKWLQNFFIPSAKVFPFFFIIGMCNAWTFYTFRNLSAILLFNDGLTNYLPASFVVRSKERRTIAIEFLLIIAIHLSILTYLEFNPIKLLLAYFLPISLAFSGVIFYIYTHHFLCPMTEINDPLINTLSIKVPKIVNLLHSNFSYHTEHHLFPNMNSDYYPQLQALLKAQYPERFNLLDAHKAWYLLLNTPRFYQDENTLTDWHGEKSVTCPLSPNNKEKMTLINS